MQTTSNSSGGSSALPFALAGQPSLPGIVPVDSDTSLSLSHCFVAFDVDSQGFVAYVNHKPVAWAVKGYVNGELNHKSKKDYYVDVAYVVQTARKRWMDTETFEFEPGEEQPQGYGDKMDVLITRARDFVVQTFSRKVGGAV